MYSKKSQVMTECFTIIIIISSMNDSHCLHTVFLSTYPISISYHDESLSCLSITIGIHYAESLIIKMNLTSYSIFTYLSPVIHNFDWPFSWHITDLLLSLQGVRGKNTKIVTNYAAQDILQVICFYLLLLRHIHCTQLKKLIF